MWFLELTADLKALGKLLEAANVAELLTRRVPVRLAWLCGALHGCASGTWPGDARFWVC